MSFAPGDIVSALASVTGYRKYFLSLGVNDAGVDCLLYLNSEGGFDGNLEFDCGRFPMIPPSDTGRTVLSLTGLARLNERQAKLFKAERLGEIDADLAREMLNHATTVKTLSRAEKAFVLERLALLVP